MKSRTITEEIERIKNLNKVITELDYSDSDPRSHGSYGYRPGAKFNPNTDYLSDIGARKTKKKEEKPAKEYDWYGNLIRPRDINGNLIKTKDSLPELDINKREDRENIIKKLLNGIRLRIDNATPETYKYMAKLLPGLLPNSSNDNKEENKKQLDRIGFNVPGGSKKNIFEIELIYYLLKESKYNGECRFPSKTFLDITSFSEHSSKYLHFKNNNNPTLDWFIDFINNNYEKIDDEMGDQFEKQFKERKDKERKMSRNPGI